MKAKKLYEEPALHVTKLSICDVITTSGAGEDPAPDDPEQPKKEPNWRLPWD